MNWNLAVDPRPKYSGHPQSWYPMCTSKELPATKTLALDAFGGKWVLFRGTNNEPAMISRYCPHMGTDLSQGDVVGGQLRCPMHHKLFDTNGQQKGKRGNKSNCAVSLKVVEYYGLIFAFWGDKVLFDFPEITDYEEIAVSPPIVSSPDCDYRAILINGFDAQHLPIVHGRSIKGGAELSSKDPLHLKISYTSIVMSNHWFDKFLILLGHKELQASYDNYGGTCYHVRNYSGKYTGFFSVRPTGPDSCTYYMVILRPKRKTLLGKLFQPLGLRIMRLFVKEFFSRDEPALRGMRVFESNLLGDEDKESKAFWDFFKKLPTKPSLNNKEI